MRAQKNFLIVITCLLIGFIATSSRAQRTKDEFPKELLGTGANLVVTSVSGPATGVQNQTIPVTYTVRNASSKPSGSYQVGLYLSTDKVIDPANDRLLDKVLFTTGLTAGKSRKTTSHVLIPNSGLSGMYYYGAVVASSRKTSANQVSLGRFTLDGNQTVVDHKTGLVWQGDGDGTTRNWSGASSYCDDLMLDGKTHWRLPRIDELTTIADYSRFNPSIDPLFSCFSVDQQLDGYWSSTVFADNPGTFWDVNFYYGAVDFLNVEDYVRCVHAGPAVLLDKGASAAGKLVITAVSGPATGVQNQTIPVTYTVRNAGSKPSGSYQVGLYLSTDKVIDPANDRLLDKVLFTTGLTAGKSRKTTSHVLIPNSGLSGMYYYGAVVASSRKSSAGQVSLPRYSLGDNNDTVTDHKTGLIWQQGYGYNTWWDAASYCGNLVLGGTADWRLPRIDELVTIIDYSRCNPSINPVFKSAAYSPTYWSSSELADSSNDLWQVAFYYGEVFTVPKNDPDASSGFVRCVRGGPW